MTAFAEALNGSVVFHGLCLDQFNQPVAGAQVEVGYNQWIVPDMIVQSPTRKKASFSTDEHGDFWVRGIKAQGMDIAILKDGYELAPHSPTSFTFEPRQTFSTNPTIYHFWKRLGAAELKSFYQQGMIPSDGRSIWIAEDYKKWSLTELTNAIIKLTVNRARRVPNFDDRSPYQWGFEIDLLGGQIQRCDDALPYEAPPAGYQATLTSVYSPDLAAWVKNGRIAFYFKTKEGHYGRGSMEIANWENNEDIFCQLDLTWNPDGSRNLESKPQ